METAPLKSFATWARTSLIKEVNARLAAVLAPGSPERVERPGVVSALEKAIAAAGGEAGKAAIADRVAYTWFNRIIALRFMDANAYTGMGIVSPGANAGGQPEILSAAKGGQIDAAVVTSAQTRDTVLGLLGGTRKSADAQGEAYAILLAEYCRHWNRVMPFMFEREGDYTELLIPSNLLADASVLNRAVSVLTKEVCQDVEVIGWLYQFYISERKEEVFAGFKKKKADAAEIPAATQLFTPHWIVRYIVENSLGRLWMLNRPASRLAHWMDYYIAPVEEETDYLKVLRPEELKIIDPACGSGHMLTYAFDLLYAIYEEEGYAPSDIPGLILTNNLYGTEIDPRAGALAAFALTMKARARQRTFFSRQVEPNICVLEPISFTPSELDTIVTSGGDRFEEEVFWNQFQHAATVGSLIRPREELIEPLRQHLDFDEPDEGDLIGNEIHERARRVVLQAGYLSSRYHIAVANPPYMGSKNMGDRLANFARQEFPDSKADLFAMFIERCRSMTVPKGYVAMITMQSWMFLQSYRAMRERIVSGRQVAILAHLGSGAFDTVAGEVVSTCAFVLRTSEIQRKEAVFIRLTGAPDEASKNAQYLSSLASGSQLRFDLDLSSIEGIPGSPLAYWLEPQLISAFSSSRRLGNLAPVCQGLATADSSRFVRAWVEVSAGTIGLAMPDRDAALATGRKWFPENKGGPSRRWYGNQWHVIDWSNDGAELFALRPKAVIRNPQHYFKASVSWSAVGASDAFRYYPPGFIFDNAGMSVIPANDDEAMFLLGCLNSKVMSKIIAALAPTLNLNAGTVADLPIPNPPVRAQIVETARAAVELAREGWESKETSWDFKRNPLITDARPELLNRNVTELRAAEVRRNCRLRELEIQNDSLVATAFGTLADDAAGAEKQEGTESAVSETPIAVLMNDLVSYAVGCMFGRYSLDEPGLILANHGDTLQDYLATVPNSSFMPDKDNVIPVVDGDWFEDDIVSRFRQFLRVAFGEQHFEENLRFVTESLAVKDLRDYFVKSFYKDHWQRYKKRPVYWLFSSPSGAFSALIYMHRYTPSTVSTVLNEYLREYRAKLEASRQHQEKLAVSGIGRQQATALKEVDRIRKILLELDDYEHNVLYPLATQQVTIELDDGVKANYPKLGAALRKIPGLEASDD
jgi:hypothetical protein